VGIPTTQFFPMALKFNWNSHNDKQIKNKLNNRENKTWEYNRKYINSTCKFYCFGNTNIHFKTFIQ